MRHHDPLGSAIEDASRIVRVVRGDPGDRGDPHAQCRDAHPGGRVVSRADLLHAGMWEGAEALELPQKASHSFLELLEPNREPVAIGTILIPPRPVDHLPDNPFQPEFEKRAIMDFE